MNDDFLKQFYQEPPEAYNRQLREQLAQIEHEQESRSNHTHKENKDMNVIVLPQRRDPPLDIFARHLLTGIVAVLMAAFVFIMMSNSPLIHSPGFLGIFQDVEEYQRDQVELYINQAWNTGDTAILSDLLSDDHVTTTTIFGTVEGIEGVADLIRSYRTAMPDFMYTINQISSVGNTVWLRGTIKGTHTGTFTLPDGTEIPPSGNSVTIDSVIRFTFEGNKISAINQVDSSQDLMEQLGAAQSIENAAKMVQNLRFASLEAEYAYGAEAPDVSHDGNPSIFVREFYVLRSGSYDVNIPFGEGTLTFSNPDYTKQPIPQNPGRRPVWDSFLDREFSIISVTSSTNAMAISFRVDARMGPNRSAWGGRRQANIFVGEPVSFEMIQVYTLNEDGTISEGWWYLDNAEYARADYGWPRKDE